MTAFWLTTDTVMVTPANGSWPDGSHLEFGRIGGIIGQQNASIRRMMNKNTTAQAYGIILATMFSILVTYVIYGAWPGLHISLILILFIGLWAGFYLAGIWAILYRPEELNRKFPLSGKELRRRKNEFYDWLSSQGRR